VRQPRTQHGEAGVQALRQEKFDYLISRIVERHFADDPDVRVDIRDSNDVHYRVYALRFLLNHGDMLGVKGGDGIIGAIGPIMRGEIKKSGQSAALGLEYDINIMGHWHQELMLPRAIVCNTLKGFDELLGCSWAPSRQGPRSRCGSSTRARHHGEMVCVCGRAWQASDYVGVRFRSRGGMKFDVDVLSLLRSALGYWYLATPYSDYPDGHDAAWEAALPHPRRAHAVRRVLLQPDRRDARDRQALRHPNRSQDLGQDNLPKMLAAAGLIVARLPSWKRSKGIADEISYFETIGVRSFISIPEMTPAVRALWITLLTLPGLRLPRAFTRSEIIPQGYPETACRQFRPRPLSIVCAPE
jgi:hypothetical protein